jgi:iron(III) transport system substrate-binding protein
MRARLVVAAVAFVGIASPLAHANPDALSKPRLTEEELAAGSKAEGGALVFYTSITNTPNQAVLAAFQKRYPWVKTSFIRKGGPVLAQQFYAEKASGIEKVDVINSGAGEVYPDFHKKGFLARLDNLPEYDGLRDIAKSPAATYLAFLFVSQPMMWNARLLKREEVPDDLWDLTKPAWKDRTASGNPTGGGASLNWYSWVCDCRKQAVGGTRPPSGLGTKWMTAMRDNNMLLPGQVGPLSNAIITGQRPLAVSQWMGSVVEAIEEGAPVDYKYPKQGTMGQHWVGGVNAKAPNPYTARLFLNWLLSQEGQIVLVQKLGAHSARKDIASEQHFPLKGGLVPFDQLWMMDLDAITAEDTKEFVNGVSLALTGKAIK